MRMTRFTTTMLLVAIFLIALNGILYYSYHSSNQERARLQQQLTRIENAVRRLQANPGVLAGSEPFPRTVPAVELSELILRAAQEHNLELLTMQTALGGTEKIGQGTYRAVRLSLALRGSPDQMIGFFAAIENGPVSTWVFDDIQLSPAGGTWDLTCELSAYALPG